ncbi:S8 family peptidase [Flavobacterium johnsoniae]|uniref:Peptidase subfamily S8A n=1 Tax=Flavobacterium johnsoniae (strain ATCC 17061 / DSM 2064 / JCM 8514 / BCRC 14874 / CCUG 350202 / NBRC 14942 / NCIMB 11054 / UW101) TaxID=376686 RepID=A5FGK5_FLAJ1|nr:S8 family peptidase [Flavobacterium johnsoniae]ABQ05666.1 Peptidase subfamily S8A [Flavobacterium johnsoniae UW101]WQG82527.1 S8 family peptidase [Flavobacterium johnsoniae UW101]SHL50458.1 Subtilase family protein [Flavobacterium johnsoniae]
MEQFPHLNFIQKVSGKPRLFGGGKPNATTEENKANRQGHRDSLFSKTSNVRSNWEDLFKMRDSMELANLDKDIVPVLIQLNPSLLNNPEFDLHEFGIEIISEEEEGFIVGASFDSLRALEQKIIGFANSSHGTAKIADLWNIIDGNREEWKPKHILSDNLFENWHNIDDNDNYTVEVGIAFDFPVKKEPDRAKKGGIKRLEKYQAYIIHREEKLFERQDHFESFINSYGSLNTSYIELDDSFSCEVTISGKGLKDLVVNYQYVFEVNETETILGVQGKDIDTDAIQSEILAPEKDSPIIGVIDSGIMENHKYIELAIDSKNSKCYVNGVSSASDHVQGGGHGTKVAGAILYPKNISDIEFPYQLPCFIRNLRILFDDNKLHHKYPAQLMKQIVEENKDCKIFNLSVNSTVPFRKKHMSTWAGIIDTLTHDQDVLFIISTGNLEKSDIRNYIKEGKNYPDYLFSRFCNIANPAHSAFGLTVGSINHHADFEDDTRKSLGGINDISAFSRIGTGIWNIIKPDVVEYGGGLTVSKNGLSLITGTDETLPELIRSTLHGGSAYGKDVSGTSFSAPKVTHIAAQLQKLYPEEGNNLIRAFIVQGARLPNTYFLNPTTESIKLYGYGLPSLERVTKNTESRITFYNTGNLATEEGHIYSLIIPNELNNPANDFDVLIEVTLTFTAKVRRTRQKIKSYLSTWLDWTSSRLNENHNQFVKRSLVDEPTIQDEEEHQEGVINWKIRERSHWGTIKDINRTNNTVQKDWVILKAYELPDELSFAVRAHKGWDRTGSNIPYAFTVSIEVLGQNIPIYESIRIANEIEIETET